jgi:hypothetical protein
VLRVSSSSSQSSYGSSCTRQVLQRRLESVFRFHLTVSSASFESSPIKSTSLSSIYHYATNRSSSQLLCHNIRSFRASTRFTTVSLSPFAPVGRSDTLVSLQLTSGRSKPLLTTLRLPRCTNILLFTPLSLPFTVPSNLFFSVVFPRQASSRLIPPPPHLRI